MAVDPDLMDPSSLSAIPSFTKTYHNKAYAAISPSRPELSAVGKHIVVTGAGSGVGKAIALGFAQAGATTISILARRLDALEATKKLIEEQFGGKTKVICVSADVTDRASIGAAFDKVASEAGKINVFVSNAGVYSDGPVATTAADEFMKVFEGNVRGTLNAFQAFLPHAAEGAILLSTSTASIHVKPFMPQASYAASKAATAKMVDFFAYEHPELHVVQVQPGVILTEMNTFLGQDQDDLPGAFFVWLTSAEAKFLRNKFVWANWDVEELIERKEEIEKSWSLTVGLRGLEF